MTKIKHTEPQIYPKNPRPTDLKKEWRVWFRCHNADTGKMQIISRKGDLNSISNFKERLASANELKQILVERLEKGWNPITNTYPAKSLKEIELERLQTISFNDALDFAASKKAADWSHKTKQDYSSVIKYIKEAAQQLDYAFKQVSELRKPHYKLILEEAFERRKLSAKGYNKYREYLSSLIGELVEWDIIEYNPIRAIKTKKAEEELAHRPPTQDERLLIVDRIKKDYRDYYRFLSVVYGCGIRPKEITRIQIKFLHKMEGVFRLPASVTKNGKAREVVIPDWVMGLLSELNLHAYSPEYYLFSGKGDMFLPGPNKMHSNSTTRYWHKIVKGAKDKGGLNLDINQYSLKKLSADDMVKLQRREGVDKLLELPKTQFDHASEQQTETYTREHIEVMKEILKKSMPEL